MIFVLLGSFRVIVDLDFEPVVDGHPFFARLERDANEDAGIVVFVAHAVDDVDSAITDFAPGPVEQPHAAVGVDEAIWFDGHIARADVLPTGEIFAVEKLAGLIGIASASVFYAGGSGSNGSTAS